MCASWVRRCGRGADTGAADSCYAEGDEVSRREGFLEVRVMLLCFFFQAEDGIRDYKVTGVQTCALPILEADDKLIEEYLEGKTVTADELAGVLPKAFALGRLVPMVFTSVKKDIGIAEFKIGRASCRERV